MKTHSIPQSEVSVHYVKQHDHFRCGPIALLNYWKWRGDKVTYADANWADDLCECGPPAGTRSATMSQVVGKRAQRVSWKQLKRALLKGAGVIVLTNPNNRGHYWFIAGLLAKGKGVFAVNVSSKALCVALSYQAVVARLRCSRVWFLEPGGSN